MESPPHMHAHGLGIAVAFVLCVSGRALLAWMPPGKPRGHALHELPATLAVSVLVGILAATAWDGTTKTISWYAFAAAALALALVAWLVSVLGGPRAMVPRHEPALPRESLAAGLALLAAGTTLAVVCVIAAWRREFPPTYGPLTRESCVMLFAPIVLWSLRTARCHALTQAATLLALVAIAWPAEGEVPITTVIVATAFGSAAAASVAWYRRADARALVLAVVFYAAILLVERDGWVLTHAGLLALVLGTPAASRGRVAARALLAAGVAGAIRVFGHPVWLPEHEIALPSRTPHLIVLLFVPVLVAWWLDARRRGAPRDDSSGAPAGHERAWILRMVLLAVLLTYAARAAGVPVRFGAVVWPALFALVLAFGLSLQRIACRSGSRWT